MHQSLGPARERALDRAAQLVAFRSAAPGEHAQQHRQRDARHAFDAPVLQQARHHVTGCGAEDVGEHEHAVAGVQAVEQLARAQHQIVGVVLAPHAEGRDLLGHVAEDLGRAREQRLADAAVRDDEDADHEVLCSSASMNIPETSNPV